MKAHWLKIDGRSYVVVIREDGQREVYGVPYLDNVPVTRELREQLDTAIEQDENGGSTIG